MCVISLTQVHALDMLVSVVIYPLSLGKNIRKLLICHLKTEELKKKSAILEAKLQMLPNIF